MNTEYIRKSEILGMSLVIVSSIVFLGCTQKAEIKSKKTSEKFIKSSVMDGTDTIGYAKVSLGQAVGKYLGKCNDPLELSYDLIEKAAEKAIDQENFEAGFVLSNRLIDLNNKAGQGYYYRGICHYNSIQGSQKSALKDLLFSIKCGLKENKQSHAYEYVSRIYYDEKKTDKAIEMISRAIELRGNHNSFYRYRALMYFDLGNFKKAESDYNKMIEVDPDNSLNYYSRAKFFESCGRYEKALKDMDMVIQEELRDGTREKIGLAYKVKAQLFIKLGKHKETIESLTKVIEMSNDVSEEYTMRGDEYLRLNKLSSAAKDYSRAIELSPNLYASAYLGRSKVYAKQGKSELAKADLEKANQIRSAKAEKPIFEIDRKSKK